MYAKIQSVTYRTGAAKCLIVRNISVQLGNRATVEWSLMGDQASDRRDYESGSNQLSGDDYSAWGQDDSYIYDWLSSQLNVTIDSTEERNYWEVPTPPSPEPTADIP